MATFIKSDAMNNRIIIVIHMENEQRVSAELYLQLRNTVRRRKLGLILFNDKEGDTFQVKRNPKEHFHYKANGYGFNDEILREEQMFNIRLIDLQEKDGLRYVFPKTIITNYGRYLHFKTEGYERQRFINISLLKPFKKENHDKRKSGRKQKPNVITDAGWKPDNGTDASDKGNTDGHDGTLF